MFGNKKKSFETAALLEVYYPRLLAYARHFTSDPSVAEDIIQDSFYSFLKKYRSCDEQEFPRIIFTITRNRCLDYLKHQKVSGRQIPIERSRGELVYGLDFASGDSAEQGYLIDEVNAQIAQVLTKLPARCREVFEMSRFQDMSNKEIAQRLDISVKTVKNHMTKALAEFHNAFPETE